MGSAGTQKTLERIVSGHYIQKEEHLEDIASQVHASVRDTATGTLTCTSSLPRSLLLYSIPHWT